MTDLFENIYLRTAGPEMYDQLATHEIPWTDQSVKDALTIMADIVGDSANMAGGTETALQTEMPASVGKVFTDSPEAAMVVIGDFAPGVVRDDARARVGLQRLHVPVGRRLRPVGGRRRRPVRRIQGQPGRRRVPRVPDDSRRRRDLGGARRVLVAEQEPRHERLPGRDHPDDGRRARRGGGLPLRPVRPAAVGVRRNARSRACSRRSPTSSRTRTTSTGSRSRWRLTPRRRTAARTLIRLR